MVSKRHMKYEAQPQTGAIHKVSDKIAVRYKVKYF